MKCITRVITLWKSHTAFLEVGKDIPWNHTIHLQTKADGQLIIIVRPELLIISED